MPVVRVQTKNSVTHITPAKFEKALSSLDHRKFFFEASGRNYKKKDAFNALLQNNPIAFKRYIRVSFFFHKDSVLDTGDYLCSWLQ